MDLVDLIEKKKQGYSHSKEEIKYIVDSMMDGTALDAQLASWLMAVCFKGLNELETSDLTKILADSGDKVNFSELNEVVVDKHSTGGVGDKVTITLIPLLAAAGISVAKLADRGGRSAAGTIDKIEAIPNFNTDLSAIAIVNQVKNIKAVIASQDKKLAPADRKLYSLRGQTATTDNDSLIASSILSKKIACGGSNIVLDIKYGAGALMKTAEEAVHLSNLMVKIGNNINKKITAVVTSLEEPLGRAVGNSLEVIEAIEFLKGNLKDGELAYLTYYFGAITLIQLGLYNTVDDAVDYLKTLVDNGSAIKKFKEIIDAQNGDSSVIVNYDKFELPCYKVEFKSKKNGYVQNINAHEIAMAAKELGATRSDKSGLIDHSVGIYLNKKSGEFVNKEETLYTIYSNDEDKTRIAQTHCDNAFVIGDAKPSINNLVYKVIGIEEEDV